MKRLEHSNRSDFRALHVVGLLAAFTAMFFGGHLATAQGSGDTGLAQTPLFVSESNPPLNMLVMGRDHKLYYEAYNDASDLNGDGVIDVGYKPDQIDYYGYFNNNACYEYSSDKFLPVAAATGAKNKVCAGGTRWSGDFLNYLTTSRMDAIRRVLYGGTRVTDATDSTVLQAAYVPRDAHAWGKAYDPARDGTVYNISDYAPLAKPASGTRHLFAVTTLGESDDNAIPRLRVLNDSRFQIWDWVSKEGTAGQDVCLGGVSCAVDGGSVFEMLSGSAYQNLSITTWKKTSNAATPGGRSQMDSFFAANGIAANRCGTGAISAIDTTGGNNNPFSGVNGCAQDNYLTEIQGELYIPAAGTYLFSVDGDDAVEATIDGTTWGWYGNHGSDRSQGNLQSRSQSLRFATPGWKAVRLRQVEAGGDDNWGLAMKVTRPTSAIATKKIRVEACSSANAALRESSCKPYPNNGGVPIYKPTGLLHDFGENNKMYFGLLSGSYQKNIAGGVLRRNISSFTEEVNPQTGAFQSGVAGVVTNIDRLRLIGFDGAQYNECGWITDGPISAKADPSMCAMWGNPVAEMMFEALRYFGGASAAHGEYSYGAGAKDSANPLNLSHPAWVPPYAAKPGGGGYQHCARPVMTVISDINPSYDTKLPGSRYQSIALNASALTGFNIANEVQAIGAAEGIHGNGFFIGQSTSSNANGAPSVKTIDDLSWVRGLSPQEPSKEGSYYAAGVARFAANNAVFGNAGGKSRLMTYSVAIASPLPEIRFPVGNGRFVTISPFAKSVTGYNIDPARFAPTNQIVDYYVDRIANTGAADQNASINGGRPYAEFRINYEDVEQGADHDMDAIARYIVSLQADGSVKVDMLSEYAAGGIGQHMGYVISGTTQDGMYLEFRDKDTASVYYALNTPPQRAPGYCVGLSSDPECTTLPLSATRTFTPNTTSSSGSFLKGPLWYAAKYGMPGRDPASVVGDPDNYFLVTNATTLKAQMTKAFNDILQNTNSVTAVSVDVPGGTITSGADVYRTRFEADGWVGDVIRERLEQNGATGLNSVRQWSAAEQLAARKTPRNILYPGAGSATPTLRPFTFAGLNSQTADAAWLTALNQDPTTAPRRSDGKAEQRIGFLRGENNTLRVRKNVSSGIGANLLGDIVNSSPLRVKGAHYRAAAVDPLEGTDSNYAAFATTQAKQPEMIYVGANDGMFHAFRAETGVEEFAFIPTAVRGNLATLAAADYGKKNGTPHRYYVDGTPVASDVYFAGAWHKVLIGSLGAGGRQVFALDITNPTSPQLLWEFGSEQSPNMGNSLAQPTIARLNDPASGKGKWVALVPSGYQGANSSAGSGGASLFVLDISNGSVMRQFDLDGGLSKEEMAASLPLGNGLSRMTAVDNNSDGKIDIAYAGDLAGNVWRFDMRSSEVSAWTVQKFFTAKDADSKRQAITAAPYVVRHPSGRGDIVIFATGRLLTASDKSNVQKQTVYGVWDRHGDRGSTSPIPLPTASKGRADLEVQSFRELEAGTGNFSLTNNRVHWYKANSGTQDDDVEKWGWTVDLPRNGEKVVYDMTLYGRGLFLSSVRTSEDPCAAGMSGTIYGIDPNTGGSTDYIVFDMNGDGVFNSSDAVLGGQVSGTTTGAGKQTIRAGRVFDPSANADRMVNHGLQFGRQSWRKQPPN